MLAQASKQMKQLRPICMLVLSYVMHLGMFVCSVNTTVRISYSNALAEHFFLKKAKTAKELRLLSLLGGVGHVYS